MISPSNWAPYSRTDIFSTLHLNCGNKQSRSPVDGTTVLHLIWHPYFLDETNSVRSNNVQDLSCKPFLAGIKRLLKCTVDLHKACVPGNEAGVFDLDPVEPAGEGGGRSADTLGCCSDVDVGVALDRPLFTSDPLESSPVPLISYKSKNATLKYTKVTEISKSLSLSLSIYIYIKP